ncbi:hypothetical protein EDB19DRAFT_1698705 [Suillus lakei]|nr:hypothetical protein EDB19DRAFT_1698705 [Suillus lakei]
MSQVTYSEFASGSMASMMTGVGISSMCDCVVSSGGFNNHLTNADRVFSILTAQVWIYFRRHTIRSRENRQCKVLVAFIWLAQAVQMVFTSRIVSVHVTEFDDSLVFIGYLSIEWALYSGICVNGLFFTRLHRQAHRRFTVLDHLACAWCFHL